MDFLYPVPLQAIPCHQNSPSRLSTSHLLTIYGQFHAASLLSQGWVGVGWWMDGWAGVVIIKLKANLSSTGTELGKIRAKCCLQKKFHQMIHYLVEQFCKIVHNLAEQFCQIARYSTEHQIQTNHVLYSYYKGF